MGTQIKKAYFVFRGSQMRAEVGRKRSGLYWRISFLLRFHRLLDMNRSSTQKKKKEKKTKIKQEQGQCSFARCRPGCPHTFVPLV